MKLQGILPFARTLLASAVGEGDIAVDATCGNGNDTLFLARLVGKDGHVFGFDIQIEAIAATNHKLEVNNCRQNVTLFHASHAELKNYIPDTMKGKIKGAVFNLGYLPGGNKTIVTKGDSTISAIESLLELMGKEAVIVLVIYHGHEQGKVERDEVMAYVKSLDQQAVHVLQYGFINQKNNPPFIVAIEKR
ncbi:class I SAM-dependent methyltransferase [Fictibacillus sp. Mic-4]|uniref:tRNA (mnm(5)s(2)U34)-methyltransferase n=1 Tax=Fictibacillus TaxID=1329200 RepID=UPI0003FD1C2D|nr:class I SAM-dependent methyltransferase [Fictibacillus gelatini]